jgi:hypothetical protein
MKSPGDSIGQLRVSWPNKQVQEQKWDNAGKYVNNVGTHLEEGRLDDHR